MNLNLNLGFKHKNVSSSTKSFVRNLNKFCLFFDKQSIASSIDLPKLAYLYRIKLTPINNIVYWFQYILAKFRLQIKRELIKFDFYETQFNLFKTNNVISGE